MYISGLRVDRHRTPTANRQTEELGGFSFSDAAAHKNSENVLVSWSNPKLAEVYLKHVERNYAQATSYAQGY